MSDDPSTSDSRSLTWIEKIAQAFSDEPTDIDGLLELMQDAVKDEALDADTLGIIKRSLQVSHKRVRDIMVPRGKVVTVSAAMPPLKIIQQVAGASHSRFPVLGDSVDNVIGILLAKDLLPHILKMLQMQEHNQKNAAMAGLDVKQILREATFVTESEPLNAMLKKFRESRRHLAIVIDEYGSMSGIITIEDVLEQIVGDIKDETDVEDNYIIQTDGGYLVKPETPIKDFNEFFHTDLDDGESSTVNGLTLQQFGRIPKRDESINIGPLLVTVLNADSRQIKMLKVNPHEA